ncbi:MAG: hypothetical protein ACI4QT_11015 [Kiritimatiellia bacterium]
MQNVFRLPGLSETACNRPQPSSAAERPMRFAIIRRRVRTGRKCVFPRFLLLLLLLGLIAGCKSTPSTLFTLPPEVQQQRKMESRVFGTDDETQILNASVSVLQELGYVFTQTSKELGIVTAICRRKADNSTTKAVFATVLTTLGMIVGVSEKVPYENDQYIMVSIVTRKAPAGTLVRTTFARRIFYSNGHSYTQRIDDPAIYDAFYKRLFQTVFPTNNKIESKPSAGVPL